MLREDACLCGHLHETTRGPCDGPLCDCRRYLVNPDTDLDIIRRRRTLLDATEERRRLASSNFINSNPRKRRKPVAAPVSTGEPAIVEDVLWLLKMGEGPRGIAMRRGCTRLDSLYRGLRRVGRQDLVETLKAMERGEVAS